MIRTVLAGCVAAVLAIAAAGCGESLNLKPASGTVTYQGRPVEGASVVFISDSGPIGTGTTDAAGKYTIQTNGQPGAVAGENRVTITKASMSGDMPANPTPEDMAQMAQTGRMPQVKAELPSKYSMPEHSGLKANVGSQETFDFELTD